MTTVRFLAVLFTALALVPAAAHLLELPNKMRLPPEDYLTLQRIYRGWALAGVLVMGALASTFALTIMARADGRGFVPALIAFLCIVATQAVFWTVTAPANRATRNWPMSRKDHGVRRGRQSSSSTPLPHLPGQQLTGVLVEYEPGGVSPPHRTRARAR